MTTTTTTTLTRSVNVVKEEDASRRWQISLVAINLNDTQLSIRKDSTGDGAAEVEHPIQLEFHTNGVGKGSIRTVGQHSTHTQAHILSQSPCINEIHLVKSKRIRKGDNKLGKKENEKIMELCQVLTSWSRSCERVPFNTATLRESESSETARSFPVIPTSHQISHFSPLSHGLLRQHYAFHLPTLQEDIDTLDLATANQLSLKGTNLLGQAVVGKELGLGAEVKVRGIHDTNKSLLFQDIR